MGLRTKPPATLYKYCSLAGEGFQRTLDTIAHRRIFLSNLDSFNDPSEGFPGLPFSDDSPSDFIDLSERLRPLAVENFGVFSMSASPDDILMWSHYADSHRGLCLGFSTTTSDSPFKTAERVAYRQSRAFKLTKRHIFELDASGLLQLSLRRGLLTKAPQWKYEQEWRLIGTPGYRPCPSTALVEIIVGHRASAEHRTWIQEWITTYVPHASNRTAHISAGYFRVDLRP